MDCTQTMNRYMELDKGERVPFAVTWHMLTCKKCRSQIKLLKLAEQKAAAPLKIPAPITDNTIADVLARISAQEDLKKKKNPVPIAGWVFGGIAMILLMLVFNLITEGIGSRLLLVSFYLIFAGVITAYCAMFIGSNIDFFVKVIQTRAEFISTL